MTTTTYVDANLHHDQATGKAVTACLHSVNATPSHWYTKRQATVETATYGSEFVAASVEKPQFPIVFNFSCAFLQSKTTCLHVSFTTYEYFYKLSKSASFSRWLLHPVTQKNQ